MLLSPNLTLKQAVHSQTAIRRGIDNTPTPEHRANMLYSAKNIFEPLFEKFNGHIRISSFYRGPALNKAVGGSKSSQHMTGEAIDIQGANGVTNAEIYRYVRDNMNFDQLIWEFGTSKEPAWVHVSLKKVGNRKQTLTIK